MTCPGCDPPCSPSVHEKAGRERCRINDYDLCNSECSTSDQWEDDWLIKIVIPILSRLRKVRDACLGETHLNSCNFLLCLFALFQFLLLFSWSLFSVLPIDCSSHSLHTGRAHSAFWLCFQGSPQAHDAFSLFLSLAEISTNDSEKSFEKGEIESTRQTEPGTSTTVALYYLSLIPVGGALSHSLWPWFVLQPC